MLLEIMIRCVKIKIIMIVWFSMQPHKYLKTVLSHKGSGSFYSSLKKRNLATSVNVGMTKNVYTVSNFLRVEIELTYKGQREVEEIVCIFFGFIDLLKNMGPQRWYWNEIKSIEEIAFQHNSSQYKSEEKQKYLNKLSKNLLVREKYFKTLVSKNNNIELIIVSP